jgi:hypothetical protein
MRRARAASFSSVSDFREEGNGYFHFLLPPGTYTLRAEPIDTQFTGGIGRGAAFRRLNGASFQPPLYSIGGSEPSQANPLAPTITPSGPDGDRHSSADDHHHRGLRGHGDVQIERHWPPSAATAE